MSTYVKAKRHTPWGTTRMRGDHYLVHACIEVRVGFSRFSLEEWERPWMRARWACGEESVRPRLLSSPQCERAFCERCREALADAS